MKKLAIFVEGQTERFFVERLIRLMIDEKRLNIAVFEASGGGRTLTRRIKLVYKTPDDVAQEFHVQIVQSNNYERVASDVRDYYEGLVARGFTGIIAIRDVHPEATLAQLPELRRWVRYRVRTVPVSPLFVLGVMEVEAWFLSEHSHFERIHPAITCDRIRATFGFDPRTDDMQNRPIPAEDLHLIYQLEGLAYRKKEHQIERTVQVLDYEYVYFEMVDSFVDLNALVQAHEQFFLPPA